jgi:putative heme-binding domain-containing protein
MSKSSIQAFLCALLSLSPAAAQHQAPADLSGAQAGERTFRRHCSGCHGRNAQGGHGPDLTRGGHSDDDLVRTISDGVGGTDMEAYRERLQPEEIGSIVAFLRASSRDETQIKGSAERGQSLYWSKGICGTCHAIGLRGTRIGADLSFVASRRSIPYLRESLTTPGAAVTPEFDFLTVITRDGKTIRGLKKQLDDFTVVLIEPSGALRSLDRTALRSVAPDKAAHTFTSLLSEAEVDDILAYLWTQRDPNPSPKMETNR